MGICSTEFLHVLVIIGAFVNFRIFTNDGMFLQQKNKEVLFILESFVYILARFRITDTVECKIF